MSDCAVLTSANEVSYHRERDNAENCHITPDTPHNCYPPQSISITTDASLTTTDSACTNASVMDAIDNCEANSEVPLRRSKRGKGRGTSNPNSATSGANAIVSTDERVASCVVGGVEYHTGDFVYYEEADFEYYTIGLIEEIKFSRRDKFMVSVKCFYRTHDIPECAKQSVLERELFHSPSNAKLKHEVLSRELFVSEVQETLASKQLRGHCKVTHLSDLRTALNTFCPDEEDNFFYVFAYNPESKRLMHTRAEIRIGDAFQAVIPNFRHPAPAHYRHVYSRCRFRCRKHGHLRHRYHRWCSTYLASRDKRDGRSLGSRKSDDKKDPQLAAESLDPPPNKSPNPLLISTAQPAECGSHPCSASPCAKTKSTDNAIEIDGLKSPPTLEIFGSTASAAGYPSGGCSHIRRWRGHGCPSLIDPITQRRLHRHRCNRRWETIVWCPQGLANSLTGANNWNAIDVDFLANGDLAGEPLKTYLDAVRSMVAFFGFGGADDDLASAENGLVLANLASTTQHAYDTLHKAHYSLKLALKNISYNPIPSKNTPRHWTADQVRLFAHALRIRGKNFHAIQRDFFGGRLCDTTVNSSNNVLHPLGTGRTRGRGRRKAISGSNSKSVKPEEDQMDVKPENDTKPLESTQHTLSTDEKLSKDATCDTTKYGAHPEPIKTVKELIAFYYYWKRKGATLGSGSGTGTQSGLTNAAAVNFSAAVAAAAASNCSLSTNTVAVNGSDGLKPSAILQQQQQQHLQQPHQPWTGTAKKRKQNSKGNALRASTPTSEISESADASPPDSDGDDPMDCNDAKIADDADFVSVKSGPTVAVSSGTTSDSNAAEIPPSGRLRRRLCRNCSKDLSLSNEAAHLTGVGQLRFLCHGCRIHLQKYGELKFTSSGELQPADDESAPTHSLMETAGIDAVKPDHHPSSPRPSSWNCEKTQASPLSTLDCCIPWHHTCRSPCLGSPCSYKSRHSSSVYSGAPDSELYSSSSSPPSSASSSRSISSLESVSDTCSSDSDRSPPPNAIESRGSKSGYPAEHLYRRRGTKRRRLQKISDSPNHLSLMDQTIPCSLPSPLPADELIAAAKSLDPLENDSSPRFIAEVSPTISVQCVPGSHQALSTKSVPHIESGRSPLEEIALDQPDSHPSLRAPSPIDHDTQAPSVTPILPPLSHPVPLDENDAIGSDVDDEVDACLQMSPKSPVPCMKEVHQSTWSHLFRTWDRSVRLVLSRDSTPRVVYNAGSCSRTDLIYEGRRNSLSELAEARRMLYALHTDTAVGPGTAVVDGGIHASCAGSSPRDTQDIIPRFTDDLPSITTCMSSPVLTSVASESAALNLSSRSAHSRSPGLFHSHNRLTTSSCVPVAPTCSHQQSSQVNMRAVTPRATPTQSLITSTQSYDPSPTQQQLQAAYEHAMLLATAAAAAAAQHPHAPYHSQVQQQQQQQRDAMHQPHNRSSTSHSSRSNTPAVCGPGSKPNHTNATQLSARVGAASGTFYPPMLGTSGRNLSSPPAFHGRIQTSTPHTPHPFSPLSQIQQWPNSSVAGGGHGVAQHIPQHTGHPASSVPALANPSATAEALWRNPEFIQRQMALMGLLPQTTLPEQFLFNNAMDPRDAESLRRMMVEKVTNHLRQPSSSDHFGSVDQHQEFLALAAATEMLMRGRAAAASGPTNNDLTGFMPNTLLYQTCTGVNSGALTSAVNSINTRPTPSVQSPHFRHPSCMATQPHTSTLPRHSYGPNQQHTPDPAVPFSFHPGFHLSPPTAHSNSSSPLPRTAAAPGPSALNYMSLLNNNVQTTSHAKNAALHHSTTASVTSQPLGLATSTTPAYTSRSPSTGTPTVQQVQEQMMNAAKLAMLAANAQSDPNKAFAFAAVLAEMAAQDKLQTQSGSFNHLMSQLAMPQPVSLQQLQQQQSKPTLPSNMFDYLHQVTGGLHNESTGSMPPFVTDRRRSGTLGGLLSGPISPSLIQSPIAMTSGRPSIASTTSQSHSRHLSTPTSTVPQRCPPSSLGGLVSNLPVFNPGANASSSSSQFTQFNQLAHSAGLTSALPLHDPAVLNAFALAAAAAYAAGPQQTDAAHSALLSGFVPEDHHHHHLDRSRLPGSMPTLTGHRPMSLQQQQAAAVAAFAALPHMNLGPRLPPSHR